MPKKLTAVVLSSVVVFLAKAMAGGPEHVPNYAGIYVEPNVGYAHVDWRNYGLNIPNFGGALSTDTSNTVGGVLYGGDIGYQFNQHFSLEGGWYDLPEVRGTASVVANVPPFIQMIAKAWVAYGAVKITLPVYLNTYIFTKVGVVLRHTRLTANFSPAFNPVTGQQLPVTGTFWSTFFALGVQYYLTPNWSINAQYMRLPGYDRTIISSLNNRLNVPAVNAIMAGVGYKFLI